MTAKMETHLGDFEQTFLVVPGTQKGFHHQPVLTASYSNNNESLG